MSIPCGTISFFPDESENINNIIRIFKGTEYATNSFKDCYTVYFWTAPKIDCNYKFLFWFPAIPTYYNRIVNKFNRIMNNIQYEVLEENDIHIGYEKIWDQENLTISSEPLERDVLAKTALFSIKYNPEYSALSRFYLNYFLHHFLRMISLGEGYLSYQEPEYSKKNDSIDFVLNLNNLNMGYRSLAEMIMKKEYILALDNIDNVNLAFNNSGFKTIKQTKLISLILANSGLNIERKFKVGDDVIAIKRDCSAYSPYCPPEYIPGCIDSLGDYPFVHVNTDFTFSEDYLERK